MYLKWSYLYDPYQQHTMWPRKGGSQDININWRDVQRKNVVNYVDMTVFKGTMTKWPVQKQTHRPAQKHTEHRVATDIKKETIFVCFSSTIY